MIEVMLLATEVSKATGRSTIWSMVIENTVKAIGILAVSGLLRYWSKRLHMVADRNRLERSRQIEDILNEADSIVYLAGKLSEELEVERDPDPDEPGSKAFFFNSVQNLLTNWENTVWAVGAKRFRKCVVDFREAVQDAYAAAQEWKFAIERYTCKGVPRNSFGDVKSDVVPDAKMHFGHTYRRLLNAKEQLHHALRPLICRIK